MALFKCDDQDLSTEMPGDVPVSIYKYLHQHLDPARPGLLPGGMVLPDERQIQQSDRHAWTPGAFDAMIVEHAPPEIRDEQGIDALPLILEYCSLATEAKKADLFSRLREQKTITYIDQLLDDLQETLILQDENLYRLACELATQSPNRELVKLGVALLGLFPAGRHDEILFTLGRHDEFTLYVAMVFDLRETERERALKQLLPHVFGWGRVPLVKRLANSEDPEIKRWLVRDACRQTMVQQYFAYTCATQGDLLAALREPSVEDEILESAGEILRTLISLETAAHTRPGAGIRGIDEYADAPDAVGSYLQHMQNRAHSLHDVVSIAVVRQFLSDPEADWLSREDRGWTDRRVHELRQACVEILQQPHWVEKIRRELESEDDDAFLHAFQAGQLLQILGLESHLERYQQVVMQKAGEMVGSSRAIHREVSQWVEKSKDLIRIANTPRDNSDRLKKVGYRHTVPFRQADFLQYPDQAENLIAATLLRPLPTDRKRAIEMLDIWGAENWTEPMRGLLEKAAENESDQDLLRMMNNLLTGLTLDD